MAKVLSSISGNLISAASAGYAPTNSADVSAIASAYQVVSATATQLYASTAHVTSINGAPISASRAGNAANASLATSAYYDGTGRLISALPDSATVSAIASAYATAKVDKSSISAQSSNWNSVYNTVSSNSASWTGSTGGGSVTSPSGTIVVMNGNEIEGTNSAVLTASAGGFSAELYPAQDNIAPSWSYIAVVSLPESGGTLTIPTNGLWNCTAIFSGLSVDGLSTKSASASATNGAMSLVVDLGGIARNISASASNWVTIQGYMTAEKAGGVQVTGVAELAWKSAVDNVTNTVSSNSASWGQGGVDSATVSAIASGYAESAASSKLDTSAQVVTATASAYDMDSYAWTTEINGLEISAAKAYTAIYANTAETAYSADFASSSDTATYDINGRFLSSLTDSATVSSIASSYADSAVSSVSGDYYPMTGNPSAFALSSDVSATVDLVGTQSANWGGSALALSAGPGVKLEKVGDTLVASVDGPLHRQETLAGYWNGSAVYQQFISGTATTNGNTNFSIPAEITGTNIVNKWIDPSNSFMYYTTTSNAAPISWCMGSARYGSVAFVGSVIQYRCVDTSPTTITAYIALKYMKA